MCSGRVIAAMFLTVWLSCLRAVHRKMSRRQVDVVILYKPVLMQLADSLYSNTATCIQVLFERI